MILFRSVYRKPSSDWKCISGIVCGTACLLLTTTAGMAVHATPPDASRAGPDSGFGVSFSIPVSEASLRSDKDAFDRIRSTAPVILAQAAPGAGGGGGNDPGGNGGGRTGGGTPGGGTTGGGTPGGGGGTPGGSTPGGGPDDGGAADGDAADGKEGGGTAPFGALWMPGLDLNDPQTDLLTAALARVAGECERIGIEYRIDCLGQGLILAGRTLPRRGEYEEARETLIKAGKDLRRVAKQNRDPAQPKIRHTIQVTPKVTRQRRLTPVAPEKLPEATIQAEAIVQEAETRLLRSAENSQRRRIHYERVAQSLGSTRRILRS